VVACDDFLRGGGEANLGVTAAHPEGAEPQTTRSGPGLGGPSTARAGAVARSSDTGLVALLWVNGGSAATRKEEEEAGLDRTKARPQQRRQ
jgi:hypothetical protein